MAAKNLGDLIFDLALDDSKFQAAITRSIDNIKRLSAVTQQLQASQASISSASVGAPQLKPGTAGDQMRGTAALMRAETAKAALELKKQIEEQRKAERGAAAERLKELDKQRAAERKGAAERHGELLALRKSEIAARMARGEARDAERIEDRKRREAEKTRRAAEREAKQKADAEIREARRAAKEAERLETKRLAQLSAATKKAELEAKKQADAEIREAKRAAAERKKSIESFESGIKKLGDALQTIALAATAAFGAIATVSVAAGAQFQQDIQTAAVISGSEFETLAEKAQEFGRDFKFSANEAAVAMRNFAQAGLKAGDNIEATRASIMLASASNADLAMTSSLVATTMKQFGIAASETGDIADIFSYALNNSKLDVESLTQAMKYAGTIGKGLGMSLEDTSAAIMMLADIGNVGSKSGTVFRLAMMRAAATTAEADRILRSYGLTQKDINPETKRFSEILDVVAQKQISVAEATKIFGLQAGASMVTLARQQAILKVLGRSYEDLVRGMKEAAKTDLAQEKAAEMMKTVMGQFTMLRSSLETLAKMIFFAYAKPLEDLLRQTVNIVNEVLKVFQAAGSGIETSIGVALTEMTEYMKKNQTTLIAFGLDVLRVFGEIGRQLLSLGPQLFYVVQEVLNFVSGVLRAARALESLTGDAITLGEVLFDIWAVTKIAQFIMLLGRIPMVITTIRGALLALRGELTATTGGLYALVSILGGLAATYGLAELGAQASASKGAISDVEAATARFTAVEEEYAKRRSDAVKQALSASQTYYRTQLQNKKELTAVESDEVKSILDLTEATAAMEIEAGRLAISNGRLVTTARIAAEAQTKQGVDTKKLTDAMAQAKVYGDGVRKTYKLLGDAFVSASEAAASATSEQERNQKFMAALPNDLKGYFASYEQAKQVVKAVRSETEKATRTEDAFANQLAKSSIVVDEMSDGTELLSKNMGDLDGSTEAANQRLAEQAKLIAQLRAEMDKSISDQQDALLAALATEDQARELSIAKQIDAEKARYKETIKQLKEAGLSEQQYADEAALAYEHLQTAIGVIGVTTTAQIAKELDKRITDVSKSLETEAQLRRDAREKRRLDELGALEVERVAEIIALQNTIGLEKDGAAAVRAAKEEIDKKYRTLSAAIDLKYNKEQRDEAVATAEKTFDIKLRGEEQFSQEVAAIEKQRSTEAQRIQQEAKDKIKSIDDQYAKSVDELVKQGLMTAKEAENAKRKFAQDTADQRKRLEDEANRRANEVLTPYEKLKKAFVGIFGEDAGKALDNLKKKFEEMGGVGKRIAQIIAKVFKGAFGVIKGGFDVVMGVVQQISGFSLNILGTIQDAIGFVQSEQKAAIEDASERAKAAGFDPAMAERRAAAATQPGDLATKFVDNLVGGAVRITQLFVAVVGPVISELAAQLPSLFTAVADAIPQIVTAFAQNIGPLVAAIVDGVPKVAIALIEAIPTIAKALIEAILYDLLPAIPEIAWSLVTSIWTALWETLKAAGGAIGGWIGSLFGGGDEGGPAAYSGMDYVPSTMRATLHQGEAVIPADRNARRLRGATAPAPAGADQNYGGRGGMGGFGPLEVAVIAEGRLLEAVQMRAEDMGRATGMGKRIRKAAGVKVGFSRGDYNPWSR